MRDRMREPQPSDELESPPSEPWVKEGLRALREQQPTDDSKRATLARLGIPPTPALEGSTAGLAPSAAKPPAPMPPAAAAPAASKRALLRWLSWGFVLGAALLLARRLLMH